jgi:hypothetical protein
VATSAPHRDVGTILGQGPKTGLSSRRRQASPPATPGAGYRLLPLGGNAQKRSAHVRPPLARDRRSDDPGPGTSEHSRRFAREADKYALKSRVAAPDQGLSPGPAAYTLDYTRAKPAAPVSTMHIRPEQRQADGTPGPGEYRVSRDLAGQRSALRIRPRDPSSDNNPGPTPEDRVLMGSRHRRPRPSEAFLFLRAVSIWRIS